MSKQENQFRIGGVYRQKNGVVAEVLGHSAEYAYVETLWAPEGLRFEGGGGRRLSDGRYVCWDNEGDDKYTLIPGELTQTASGWVALGAEKQEHFCNRDVPEGFWDFVQRELRKGEPTSADLAMIARDDTAAARRQAETRKYLDQVEQMLAATLPSTAKPNPFPTTLRSPDCDSGPSDHLNASRHQMAAIKG